MNNNMNFNMFFYPLIIIFIILNILDGHSTLKVISKTSIKSEKNPVARFLFKLVGPLTGIICLKSILIPVIILMMYYFYYKLLDMIIILIIANFFYLAVVIHNYKVFNRITKNIR